MCGIVGYIGKTPITLKSLVDNAEFNSYRGDDGVGMIYLDNDKFKIRKYLLTLEEIKDTTLKEDRVCVKTRVGSFEFNTIDKEAYNKKNEEFSRKMKQILNLESKFAFIHHRKGTYGDDSIKNLHPIKFQDKYYIHNGTAYGIYAVRNYLQVFHNMKLTSEIDTEILGILYTKLKETYSDKSDVYKSLQDMFPNGWGVLIEIDTKSGDVTIIKDNTRELWLYILDSGGIMLISEPTPYIDSFKKVIRLSSGIFSLRNKDYVGIDYTEELTQALTDWNNLNQLKFIKCDRCEKTKYVTRINRQYSNVFDDFCLECQLFKLKEQKTGEKNKTPSVRDYNRMYIGELCYKFT